MRCLGDVFEEQGGLETRDRLSEDFKINFNSIDYTRLIKAIPQEYIIENIEFDREEIDPWCQQHVQIILGDDKSNQLVKKELPKEKIHPNVINKWETMLLMPEEHLFRNKIFMLPKRCNQDVWMQMSQYKILHHLLATNKNYSNLIL